MPDDMPTALPSRDKDPERRAIVHALQRLLDGTPLRSDGRLTVVSLAKEAGVKRHVLTEKHTDLKDVFYARVRDQGSTATRSEAPELERLRTRVRELTDQTEQQRTVIHALARTVQALQTKLAPPTGDRRIPSQGFQPRVAPGPAEDHR